jgi:hypothetical protein
MERSKLTFWKKEICKDRNNTNRFINVLKTRLELQDILFW